ncbi:cutinase family protein [Gordonia phthalatica]|uniref:Cutinase n=1 Tax=Gordonia phthalatica TaxID=1136941 RepID=A0A0N7FU45_9ACTN|nr:cutinase family protein [Gordonia phthalatica]ALG83335.1 cutinase [Gordonia phthalatica]
MLRRILVLLSCLALAAVGLTVGGASTGTAPAAAAPKCADVHVLFARGTVEAAPPLGLTGIAFQNSLRNRLRGKTVRVEAVQYAASSDFREKLKFAESFVKGVEYAQRRMTSIAATCPDTKIVLGGYSQGAALAGYAISSQIKVPQKYSQYRAYLPKPLSADVAKHVAAVVEFAPPSKRFIREAGAPAITPQAAYRGKTARYCMQGDTICNGAPLGGPNALHLLYSVNGMTDQAAGYVARRV